MDNIVKCLDPNDVAEKCALFLEARIRSFLKMNSKVTIALAGGSSPRETYLLLAKLLNRDDWRMIHTFLVDERYVDSQDVHSNFRMIRETLLSYSKTSLANMYRVKTELPTAELAANDYEHRILEHFNLSSPLSNKNIIPSFDLILLGIGTDGHVASLFPDSKPDTSQIMEVQPLTRAILFDDERGSRITMTMPTINAAKEIVFLAYGENKRDIVRKVLQNRCEGKSEKVLPATQVLPKGDVTWFLSKDIHSQGPKSTSTVCSF